MKKDDIRRQMRARKAVLTAQERRDAATAAFAMLQKTAAFMLADTVLMYHSLPDELSTHAFLEAWGTRKRMFLPRVNGVNLDILPYDQTRLALGAFHIEEPQGDETADIADIEAVVVPAVAYDRRGNRVGRGKGYYDRLLATTRAVKIGIAYDFQLLDDDIEGVEATDVPVDLIITPTRILYTHHH